MSSGCAHVVSRQVSVDKDAKASAANTNSGESLSQLFERADAEKEATPENVASAVLSVSWENNDTDTSTALLVAPHVTDDTCDLHVTRPAAGAVPTVSQAEKERQRAKPLQAAPGAIKPTSHPSADPETSFCAHARAPQPISTPSTAAKLPLAPAAVTTAVTKPAVMPKVAPKPSITVARPAVVSPPAEATPPPTPTPTPAPTPTLTPAATAAIAAVEGIEGILQTDAAASERRLSNTDKLAQKRARLLELKRQKDLKAELRLEDVAPAAVRNEAVAGTKDAGTEGVSGLQEFIRHNPHLQDAALAAVRNEGVAGANDADPPCPSSPDRLKLKRAKLDALKLRKSENRAQKEADAEQARLLAQQEQQEERQRQEQARLVGEQQEREIAARLLVEQQHAFERERLQKAALVEEETHREALQRAEAQQKERREQERLLAEQTQQAEYLRQEQQRKEKEKAQQAEAAALARTLTQQKADDEHRERARVLAEQNATAHALQKEEAAKELRQQEDEAAARALAAAKQEQEQQEEEVRRKVEQQKQQAEMAQRSQRELAGQIQRVGVLRPLDAHKHAELQKKFLMEAQRRTNAALSSRGGVPPQSPTAMPTQSTFATPTAADSTTFVSPTPSDETNPFFTPAAQESPSSSTPFFTPNADVQTPLAPTLPSSAVPNFEERLAKARTEAKLAPSPPSSPTRQSASSLVTPQPASLPQNNPFYTAQAPLPARPVMQNRAGVAPPPRATVDTAKARVVSRIARVSLATFTRTHTRSLSVPPSPRACAQIPGRGDL